MLIARASGVANSRADTLSCAFAAWFLPDTVLLLQHLQQLLERRVRAIVPENKSNSS
jgi:hypothetical protein